MLYMNLFRIYTTKTWSYVYCLLKRSPMPTMLQIVLCTMTHVPKCGVKCSPKYYVVCTNTMPNQRVSTHTWIISFLKYKLRVRRNKWRQPNQIKRGKLSYGHWQIQQLFCCRSRLKKIELLSQTGDWNRFLKKIQTRSKKKRGTLSTQALIYISAIQTGWQACQPLITYNEEGIT